MQLCYVPFTSRKNFYSCTSFSSRLVNLVSDEPFAIFIGATDIVEEGNWVWVDNSTVSREDILWGPSDPNNGGRFQNQDCALIVNRSYAVLTDDINCALEYHALCEKQAPC